MVTVSSSPSGEPAWSAATQSAELVVRFQVTGTATSSFASEVVAALRESALSPESVAGATLVLCQPLLGTDDSEAWELRVSAPSWEKAGSLFDTVTSSQAGGIAPLLRHLEAIEGVTVDSAGAPLFRVFTLTPGSPTD